MFGTRIIDANLFVVEIHHTVVLHSQLLASTLIIHKPVYKNGRMIFFTIHRTIQGLMVEASLFILSSAAFMDHHC